jgi:hypothetical protein
MKLNSIAFIAIQNPLVIFLQKIVDGVLVAFIKSLRLDSEVFPVAALLVHLRISFPAKVPKQIKKTHYIPACPLSQSLFLPW